ncbi:glucose-induced degradation protein 4 [Tanacetum coccineum]
MPRTLSLRIGCCLNIFSPLIAHEVGRVDSQCCRIARRALDKSMKHRSNRKSHEIPRTETYSAHTALLILVRRRRRRPRPKNIGIDNWPMRQNLYEGMESKETKSKKKIHYQLNNVDYSRIAISTRSLAPLPIIGAAKDTPKTSLDSIVDNSGTYVLTRALLILAKNQINDSYTTQAWFSQDKELEDKVAKISLETGTIFEYTHTVLLKTEPQAITSKSGKKKENTERLVTEQIKVLHNLGLGFRNVIATIENILPGDLFLLSPVMQRWKEQYFVNIGSDCGLIIAGFYYVCFSCVDGSINGYYYDTNSSPLQLSASAAVWNDVTQQFEELKQRAKELGHRIDEL